MSKKLLKMVLFVLGVLFFTGGACPSNDTTLSNKVAQSEIYQNYSVSESGQNYNVTAFFRIGGATGTTLALVAPSRVTFNGQPMQERKNTSSGTFYTIDIPKNTPNGAFSFTDRDGKTYVNKIDLTKVSLNPAPMRVNGTAPVSIPLSHSATDTSGFSLEMNDQTVFIEPSADDSAEAYFDKAKSAIVVLPVAWKKIPNGNVSLNLEVRNSIPTQQGTGLGGNMSFTYNTASVNVALLKGKTSNTNSALANSNKKANTSSTALKRSNSNLKAVNNSANSMIPVGVAK